MYKLNLLLLYPKFPPALTFPQIFDIKGYLFLFVLQTHLLGGFSSQSSLCCLCLRCTFDSNFYPSMT